MLRRVEREDLAEAGRLVDRLLAFDAGDPRLLMLRGSLALEASDLAAALEFFAAAADFGDELARAHLELGRLYYQSGLPGRALEELDRCRRLASPRSLVGEAAGRLAESVRREGGTP